MNQNLKKYGKYGALAVLLLAAYMVVKNRKKRELAELELAKSKEVKATIELSEVKPMPETKLGGVKPARDAYANANETPKTYTKSLYE